MSHDIQNLISRLSRAEAQDLYNRLTKSKKVKKSPTYVQFPPPADEIKTYGVPQVCVSKNDVIRHLGEILLEDLDKMSTTAIKSRAAEALIFLSEFETADEAKKNTLGRAVKIVMELDREKLMYKIATLATLSP